MLGSSPSTKISCVGSLFTFNTLSDVLRWDASVSIINEECGYSKCYCKQFDSPPNGAALSVITLKLNLDHDHWFVQSTGAGSFFDLAS
jgi:hypothetical protein